MSKEKITPLAGMTTRKRAALRKTIIHHIAWMLWTDAWVNYMEDEERSGKDPKRVKTPSGKSWDPYVPKIPDAIHKATTELVASIERMNDAPIERLYLAAEALANEETVARKVKPTPERFGECIAYHAAGSGVSWMDDFPDPKQKWPNLEVVYDGEDNLYVGGVDERFVD